MGFTAESKKTFLVALMLLGCTVPPACTPARPTAAAGVSTSAADVVACALGFEDEKAVREGRCTERWHLGRVAA
jgi:hypothetical protein